jgi:hypothetical protein
LSQQQLITTDVGAFSRFSLSNLLTRTQRYILQEWADIFRMSRDRSLSYGIRLIDQNSTLDWMLCRNILMKYASKFHTRVQWNAAALLLFPLIAGIHLCARPFFPRLPRAHLIVWMY